MKVEAIPRGRLHQREGNHGGYGVGLSVLDWLYEVDKFFNIMDITNQQRVKIVANKFYAGVGAWWESMQDQC
ncbi:hypothetical protein OSB04_019593 [Centaurea solstitialis]|uniref:Uncharacterized protein n=1 Tax=Centaurea solstitialis TaxID=347529 RepID=A0AA38SQL9_9ASTR|nr:hypothetical protein OSB04_019593 [Centaurea solstitialis]